MRGVAIGQCLEVKNGANLPEGWTKRGKSHPGQEVINHVFLFLPHLRFKHAQPKMCHSPKVENGVDN